MSGRCWSGRVEQSTGVYVHVSLCVQREKGGGGREKGGGGGQKYNHNVCVRIYVSDTVIALNGRGFEANR